ncbi:unnamed protein product [Mytilus edulis]|uniref:THAP-type domain-containing protein n=1 Tax=Mytilus edulis TaxID=6550 RepID=A0A8S3S1P8_MYTED|nr:unnamed protein product [Mytilus edulis]
MPRGDRGGSSRGSGTRCVAANCGNTNADGFSLHSFPKDPNLRRKWTGFVKLKRANWDGPTEFSALCSVHFIIDYFPFRHRFEIEHMGRAPKKAKLNVGAVPTVVEYEVDDPKPTTASFSCQVNKRPKRDKSIARLIQRPRNWKLIYIRIGLSFQRNEVKSSCDMEKEELQRSLEFCKDHNIKIKTLVTDRHVQINKRVRENMEDTTHAFNVWHVAKGKDR